MDIWSRKLCVLRFVSMALCSGTARKDREHAEKQILERKMLAQLRDGGTTEATGTHLIQNMPMH